MPSQPRSVPSTAQALSTMVSTCGSRAQRFRITCLQNVANVAKVPIPPHFFSILKSQGKEKLRNMSKPSGTYLPKLLSLACALLIQVFEQPLPSLTELKSVQYPKRAERASFRWIHPQIPLGEPGTESLHIRHILNTSFCDHL